jgi:hypothetical protein
MSVCSANDQVAGAETRIFAPPCYPSQELADKSPAASSTGILREKLSPLLRTWATDLVRGLASGTVNVGRLNDLWANGEGKGSSVPSLRASVKRWSEDKRVNARDKFASIDDAGPTKLKNVPCTVDNEEPAGCTYDYDKISTLTLFRQVMALVHQMIADRSYLKSESFRATYLNVRKAQKDLNLPALRTNIPLAKPDPLDAIRDVGKSFCDGMGDMSHSFSKGHLWNKFKNWVTSSPSQTASCKGGLLAAIHLVLIAAEVIAQRREAGTPMAQGVPDGFRLWNQLRVSDALLCFLARMSGSGYTPSNFPTCVRLSTDVASLGLEPAPAPKKGGWQAAWARRAASVAAERGRR